MYTPINKYIEKKLGDRELIIYEMERSINQWTLSCSLGRTIKFDTLKELIEYFIMMRGIHVDLNQDVEIYDLNRKIRYREIHHMLRHFDIAREAEELRIRNRIRKHRATGVKRIMPVSKIDPRLTRPILREEKSG